MLTIYFLIECNNLLICSKRDDPLYYDYLEYSIDDIDVKNIEKDILLLIKKLDAINIIISLNDSKINIMVHEIIKNIAKKIGMETDKEIIVYDYSE